MNRETIAKESKKWVSEQIITELQREQLLERYSEKQTKPLLYLFAGIFVGLGFLTFIASNWGQMHDLVRMGLILSFLTAFYLAGYQIYKKHNKTLGSSLIIIALLLFGAGIFLTGQMYHYISYNAFPFFLWSLAGYTLFLLFREKSFFVVTILLMTTGQLYSGMVFQSFHLWTGLLFAFGIGWTLYREKDFLMSFLFGLSYLIQSLVLIFSEGHPYYWLLILFLLLYLFNDLVVKANQTKWLQILSVLAIFIFHIFEVFLLSQDWFIDRTESSFSFFIVWAVLFVSSVTRSALSSGNYNWIDLILFVPVFRFAFGDVLSLILLFIYALLWLVFGYQKEVSRWVTKGTFAFLVATFLAYFQLAWDFMDRSLFFFTGGILLFVLGFLLERKRRGLHKEEIRS